MDTLEIVTLLASVIALGLSLYLYQRSGRTITLTGVQEAYRKGTSLAAELEKVGLMAVASVQQLKETGKINTDEEAFNAAFDYIATWPGMGELDRNLIAHAVEGSYHLYKELYNVRDRTTETPSSSPLES